MKTVPRFGIRDIKRLLLSLCENHNFYVARMPAVSHSSVRPY